jgi:acetolactate synthase I/II/III large subunit
MDVMTGQAQCKPIGLSRLTDQGPAAEASLREAARLINSARMPVVFLGLMASKPKVADAIHSFLSQCSMPVVASFQAAGAISRELVSPLSSILSWLICVRVRT